MAFDGKNFQTREIIGSGLLRHSERSEESRPLPAPAKTQVPHFVRDEKAVGHTQNSPLPNNSARGSIYSIVTRHYKNRDFAGRSN